MEIERSLFRDEEEKAKAIIKYKYPRATDEFIVKWLDRWWDNKKHLIKLMGGIRLEAPIETDTTGAEESEDSRDDGESHSHLLNTLFTKIDLNRFPTYFLMSIDEPDRTVVNFLEKVHNANVPVGLYWKGECVPKRDDLVISTVGRVFIEPEERMFQQALIERAIRNGWLESELDLPTQFMYIDFTQFVGKLVQTTPIDKIIEGRLESGMKLGKFLKQMFPPDRILFKGKTVSQVGGGETEFTSRPFHDAFDIIWSQVVQEFRCVGTIVLSASPVDLITMAVTSTWSSCSNFKGGQASIGGLAYAADNCTLIGYVPREKPVQEFGVEFADKKWRSICHIDQPNGTAVFGNPYPNSNAHNAKALRKAVNHMLADYHGVSRNWKKCNGTGELRSAARYIYSETGGPRTRLKEMEDKPVDIKYGVENFACFQCGNELNTASNLTCGPCNGMAGRGAPEQIPDPDLDYTCPACGDDYPGDVMVWYAQGGTFICDYCRDDDYFSCDGCGELMHRDNSFSAGMELYCEECFNENFFYCHRCDEITLQDDSYYIEGVEESWCEYCAEHYTFFCDCCEERTPDEYTSYETAGGEIICEHCYEDRFFTCFDCEEIHHDYDAFYVEDIEADICCDCRDSGGYFECGECGQLYTTDEETSVYSIAVDDTVSLCKGCAENVEESNRERREVS